jgi:hypothetical protein
MPDKMEGRPGKKPKFRNVPPTGKGKFVIDPSKFDAVLNFRRSIGVLIEGGYEVFVVNDPDKLQIRAVAYKGLKELAMAIPTTSKAQKLDKRTIVLEYKDLTNLSLSGPRMISEGLIGADLAAKFASYRDQLVGKAVEAIYMAFGI